jgi:hypothetical protein
MNQRISCVVTSRITAKTRSDASGKIMLPLCIQNTRSHCPRDQDEMYIAQAASAKELAVARNLI